MTTNQWRAAVTHLRATYPVSERRACRLTRLARSRWQHRSTRPSDAPLAEALKAKATDRPRWGYRRLAILLAILLRRDGWRVNLKRVLRVYRAEGLRIRKQRRRKQVGTPRVPRPTYEGPNTQWTIDFISDQLAGGRRFRVLSVVDECTREWLRLDADVSWPSAGVAAVLEACGRPSTHWFLDLADARRIVGAWRDAYNTVRPHSSLGGRTPAEYAAMLQANAELESAHPLTIPT